MPRHSNKHTVGRGVVGRLVVLLVDASVVRADDVVVDSVLVLEFGRFAEIVVGGSVEEVLSSSVVDVIGSTVVLYDGLSVVNTVVKSVVIFVVVPVSDAVLDSLVVGDGG